MKEFPLKDRIFAFQDHGAPAPSPAFAAGQKRWREVIRAGHIEILNDANAIVTNANCGMCPGLHGGVLAPGDVAIACNTRNFEGRMGPNASIYLASSAAVAESALKGKIVNLIKYL